MVLPPPCFMQHKRQTPEKIKLMEKQMMADKIMSRLKSFQPKKSRKLKNN